MGKTFDTFCPLGPVVDTSLDPSSLSIKSWINDDLMQDSNTKHLIFDIPVSVFMSLFMMKYISVHYQLAESNLYIERGRRHLDWYTRWCWNAPHTTKISSTRRNVYSWNWRPRSISFTSGYGTVIQYLFIQFCLDSCF